MVRELLGDVIVLLDQRGDIAGGAGGGNLAAIVLIADFSGRWGHLARAPRRTEEAEALVEIGDELVARHFFKFAVVAGTVLIR